MVDGVPEALRRELAADLLPTAEVHGVGVQVATDDHGAAVGIGLDQVEQVRELAGPAARAAVALEVGGHDDEVADGGDHGTAATDPGLDAVVAVPGPVELEADGGGPLQRERG